MDFLKLLLSRTNTLDLTVETTRAVAMLAADVVHGRRLLIAQHISDVLVPYLQVNHEDIVLSTGRALVNLTSDNAEIKVDIVVANGIRMIVQQNHLIDKGPEIIKTMCTLIKNCLNSDDTQRKKVTQDGVAIPLLLLLKHYPVRGLAHKDEVMVKAAAAVWNLCACDDGKEAILQSDGLETLSTRLRMTDNVELIEKCCGALMMLCASHDGNKRTLLEDEPWMKDITTKIGKIDNMPALRNAAGLLSILSTLEKFRDYKEQAAQVIDKVSKMLTAENQKRKKDPTLAKVQVFIDLLQKNVSG